MNNFESAVAAIARDVRALQVWPLLPDPVQRASRIDLHDINNAVPVGSVQCSVTDRSGQGSTQPTSADVGNSAAAVSLLPDGGYTIRNWAATAESTPYSNANRFAALGSTTDDDNGPQQPFAVVESRRKSRRRRRSSDVQQSQQSSSQHQWRTDVQQRRRGPLLLGKAKNDSVISAARQQRKKSVLCVDNISTQCSVAQMTEFIASLHVKVVSCFEVKPRHRYNESEDDVKDKKAFRVCIYADELYRLLEADAWPENVTVSILSLIHI